MKILILSPVPLLAENDCGISKILFNYILTSSDLYFHIYSPEIETDVQIKNFPNATFSFYKKNIQPLRNTLRGQARSQFSRSTINQLLSSLNNVGKTFDVIHFFSYSFIPALSKIDYELRSRCTISLIDSHPLFFERRAKKELNPFKRFLFYFEARKYLSLEKQIPQEFKIHFVSKVDSDHFKAVHGNDFQKVTPIENGVRLDHFFPTEDSSSGTPCEHILFFGNLEYSPNKDALHFICQELGPHLQAEHKNLSLLIAGRSSHPIQCGNNISVMGYVDDLNQLLNQSKLIIFPLFFGTGIKNKVLEALSTGAPIISTSVGLEGIPLSKLPTGYPLKVINERDPKVWASEIEKVIATKCGPRTAYRPFSWELFAKKMRQLYLS